MFNPCLENLDSSQRECVATDKSLGTGARAVLQTRYPNEEYRVISQMIMISQHKGHDSSKKCKKVKMVGYAD